MRKKCNSCSASEADMAGNGDCDVLLEVGFNDTAFRIVRGELSKLGKNVNLLEIGAAVPPLKS